jgi:hypothetical protein
MCYNCGCQQSDKDHGNPANITDKTFEDAAKASRSTPQDAKQNTLDMLKKSGKGK